MGKRLWSGKQTNTRESSIWKQNLFPTYSESPYYMISGHSKTEQMFIPKYQVVLPQTSLKSSDFFFFGVLNIICTYSWGWVQRWILLVWDFYLN